LNIDVFTTHDWRRPLVNHLQNPNLSVDQKTKYKTVNYIVIGVELYRKDIDGVQLKCLGESKTYVALVETHEGIFGSHQVGEKMK